MPRPSNLNSDYNDFSSPYPWDFCVAGHRWRSAPLLTTLTAYERLWERLDPNAKIDFK